MESRLKLKDQQLGEITRKSFSRTRFNLELPDLVEVQTKSFKWFLEQGLTDVLREVSPVKDGTGQYELEYVSYSLGDKPNYSIEECKARDATYSVTMKITARLIDHNDPNGGLPIQDDVTVLTEFPMMTDCGTFVINGAERVIVSQIARSPGMYFSDSKSNDGDDLFAAQIIPTRGAWLEYETDQHGVLYAKIDKNHKVPMTQFIRALGADSERDATETGLPLLMTRDDVYGMFGHEELLTETFEKDLADALAVQNGTDPHVESLKEIYKKLRPGEPALIDTAKTLLTNYFFDARRYDISAVGRYKFNKKMGIAARIANRVCAELIASPWNGEVLCDEDTVITPEIAREIENHGVNRVTVKLDNGNPAVIISNGTCDPLTVIGNDLSEYGIKGKVTSSVLREIVDEVGDDADALREQVILRTAELSPRHLTKDDIFATISYILNLAHGIGHFDDIDHLGNRRVRSVGEQLQNSFRIGLVRMEKTIRERMSTKSDSPLSIKEIINVHPLNTAVKEFFGSSQLSQFADQNNPLADLTHRRRLSALGPGGLSRDRASFDVRDVHYTQYGRMCPIETPEGPNIGLISYLTTYARINEYGFIEAPYRVVDKATHRVTDEVVYMTADVEDNYVVAQANEPLDENGYFINKKVTARDRTEIDAVDVSRIDFMDVSPKMVVSVATAMIPFLENDDNSRALMGANMQKQAVPLMVTDNPIVGTGMEYKAAVDSGVVVIAEHSGIVEHVEANSIHIQTENGIDKYTLRKFKRTNQGTCFNQRPIVRLGQRVTAGQVIADGPATSHGEMSLGKNALIGFMTWEGYNYEDAVLLNERLVRDDVYTSVHIEEYTSEARRNPKLGDDTITGEIPNVGEDALRNLDGDGIIRIGAEVRAGDILVGKVSPKGETEITAEERLLRAIFEEKAKDVRDTSLKMPHGESGVVIDVRVFTNTDQNSNLPHNVLKRVKVYVAQKRKISVGDKMAGRHGNKGVVSRILPPEDMPFLADGTPLDIVLNPLGVPSRMNIGQVLEVHLGIAARKLDWKIMTPVFDGATERDISECLRMAGICRNLIANENPEGKDLYELVTDENGNTDYRLLTDEQRADPAYIEQLRLADTLRVFDGKSIVYDGRTGEPFDNPVTVGIMYYLKLHHLVDDKIHARSNGPYSLVTQQPLGGKAQFGGQRFGEMEVWALEAYGAAYTLQEILTIKSDDVMGRRAAFEAIIKGGTIPRPGVPESFKVLVKELQALALDIKVLDTDGKEIDMSVLNEEVDRSAYRRIDLSRTREDRQANAGSDDDESLNEVIDTATGTSVENESDLADYYIEHSDTNPDEEFQSDLSE